MNSKQVSSKATRTSFFGRSFKGLKRSIVIIAAVATVSVTAAFSFGVSAGRLQAMFFGAASGAIEPGKTVERSFRDESLSESSQTTLADGALEAPRSGHTATLLDGGGVLVAGGSGDTSAEVYDAATGVSASTGNLNVARTGHTATKLADGRVLITGGSGDTSSEIYDPASGTFGIGPAMTLARSGHTATLLANGGVLIAGGGSDTAEIFDGTTFAAVEGTMTASRTNASAVRMNDGRIFIAGGDGSISAEIFDPADSTFAPAGGSMTVSRSRAHLRVLPDGKVQIIGGSNDGSMEVYDPAADIIGAYAHVVPETDPCANLINYVLQAQTRAALIFSGSPAPERNRSGFTITELGTSAVLIGGSDANGATSTITTFASSTATVTTDKLDYAPGQTVTLTGTGYDAGETVRVKIHEDPHTEFERGFDAVADENGNFTGTYLVQGYDQNVKFVVGARGLTSQRTAQTTFTDAVTLYWRGCTDTNWTTIANWRTSSGSNCSSNAAGNYPGALANDVANIEAVANQPTISSAIANSLAGIQLPSGTTLTVATGGSVTFQNDVVIHGTVNQTGGTITVASGKKLLLDTGSASQSGGTLNAPIVEIKSGRTFSQSGTGLLVVGTGSGSKEWKNEGTFTSTGGRVLFSAGTTWTSPAGNTNQFFDVEWDAASVTLNTAQTISVRGDWQADANVNLTSNTSTVVFNGSGTQQITGGNDTSFRNLTINKSGGNVTLIRNTFVGGSSSTTGTLLFTLGNIVTGSNKVTIRAGSSVSRTSGHVEGNLEKSINTTASTPRIFEVGTGTNYTPISVSISGLTGSGGGAVGVAQFLIGSSTAGDHPSLAGSGINASRSANRYWSLVRNGTWTFTNYDVTTTFVAGDVDAGATPTNFQMRKFNSPSTWTAPPGGTTAAALFTTGNDYTAFSDYAVGETNVAPTASAVTINDTTPEFGQTLTGNYTYGDADGDLEGTSTFRWLRNGTTVVGTSQSYLVVTADIGQTLTFEVTPVALTGVLTGTAVQSAATSAVAKAATALNVSSASGAYGGQVNLTATLTRTSLPVGVLSGKTVNFTLNGNSVGSAPTDVTGTATLLGVYLTSDGTAGGTRITANTYPAGVGASFTTDSDYAGSSETDSLTVNQKSVTATVTAANKGYDGNATAAINSCSVAVLESGDTVTCSAAGPNTFDNENAGTGKTVTATNISLGGTHAANYVLSSTTATTTADVLTKAITATLTAGDKVYDGNTTEPNSNMSCSLTGVIAADALNVACTPSAGTFNTPDVATAHTVTATATISGTEAGNYTLGAAGTFVNSTGVSDAANITPATPTVAVSFAASPVTYTGSPYPATVVVTGVAGPLAVPGDGTVVVTYLKSGNPSGVPTDAGSYTASAAFTSSNTNYTNAASTVDATLTIAKAATTTVVTCANGTYTGSAVETCTYTVTGANLNIGPSPLPSANYANNINAGTNTASGSFSYAESDNHLASSDSKNFSIAKAATTTTVTCTDGTYTGSAVETCTYTVTGANLSIPATAVPAGNYTNNVNAGTETASASFTYAESANHLGSSDSDTFSIAKAATTTDVVCADGTYTGSAVETCTYTVTGANLSIPSTAVPSGNYTNNVNAGTETASASFTYAESANHLSSSDSDTFSIARAGSITTITCGGPYTYTGSAITPCTYVVRGAETGNPVLVSATAVPIGNYANNLNAGSATAGYTYPGDTNHTGSTGNGGFTISPAPTVITPDGNVDGTNHDCTNNTYTATLTDGVTGQHLTSINLKMTIGTQNTTADTDSSETATFTLTLAQPTGVVQQKFELNEPWSDPNRTPPVSVTRNFTILGDPSVGPGVDADSLYTGSSYFWTTSPTSSTATLTLSATIKDTFDLCPTGDITKAKVSFFISTNDGASFSPVSSAQNLPVGLVDPSDPTTGAASAIAQYNIGNNQSITLVVRVVVGGYYSMTGSFYDSLITIGKPGSVNSLTGGGRLRNDGSPYFASGYLGTASVGSGFGAQVTYTKSGSNPKGQVTVTIRSCNKIDGTVDPNCTASDPATHHVYWIKSNSISELSRIGGAATFGAKTNGFEQLPDGSKVNFDSGNTMQLVFTPQGRPMPPQTYAPGYGSGGICTNAAGCASIVLFRSAGGVWYSSSWGLAAGNPPITRTVLKHVVGGTVAVN